MDEISIGFYSLVTVLTFINTYLSLKNNEKIEKYRSDSNIHLLKLQSYSDLESFIRGQRNFALKLVKNFDKHSLEDFSTEHKEFEKVLDRNEIFLKNDRVWKHPVHEYNENLRHIINLFEDYSSTGATGEIIDRNIVITSQKIDKLYKKSCDTLSNIVK